jgi:membrane protease YdiL (CAAX protease family)
MKRYILAMSELLIFLLIFTLSQLAFGFVFYSIKPLNDALNFMLSYVGSMLFTLLIFSLYERLRGYTRTPIMCSRKGTNPILILRGVLILAALFIVLLPLNTLLPADSRTFPDSGWSPFTLCLLAPIFEEVLFRGKLFNLLGRTLQPSQAAMLSALAFGVVHLQPAVIIDGFITGIILSYFYIKCRSILAPIILHAINNTVAFALLSLSYKDVMLKEYIDNIPYSIVVYMVAAIFLIISFIRIFKKFNSENLRQQFNEQA